MDHATGAQLQPAAVLAGGAALAAADLAADIQLEAGFHEGEEAGTQADLQAVVVKDLAEHGLHGVDQVGDGDVLAHHHAFHLEEGVLMAGIGGFVAEAAAGEHSLDGLALVDQGILVLFVDGILGSDSCYLKNILILPLVLPFVCCCLYIIGVLNTQRFSVFVPNI